MSTPGVWYTRFPMLMMVLFQNEYAQILAKRHAEIKAHKVEDRKRRASSLRK